VAYVFVVTARQRLNKQFQNLCPLARVKRSIQRFARWS